MALALSPLAALHHRDARHLLSLFLAAAPARVRVDHALERGGLDRHDRPAQRLDLLQRLQDFPLGSAAAPARGGCRRRADKPPAERRARRNS